VFAVFVLEKVVDAFLLHQALDEVQVGFAVLDAVFPLGVRAVKVRLEIAEAAVAEDRQDDVRNGHVLVDAEIGCAPKEPQPRDDLHVVLLQIAALAGLVELAHEPVPHALGAAVLVPQAKRHVLPDDVGELDVVVVADRGHGDREHLPELLGNLRGHDQQLFVRKRRAQGQRSEFLSPCRHQRSPNAVVVTLNVANVPAGYCCTAGHAIESPCYGQPPAVTL
jgi:hypothetical protein